MDELNVVKQESASDLSVHDIHQYSISYGIVVVLLIAALVAIFLRVRRKRSRRMQLSRHPAVLRRGHPVNIERQCVSSEQEVQPQCSELRKSVSMGVLSVDRGSAPPKPPRSVSISIPCESLGEIIESSD
ncbi:uncharacterized protein LOC114357957 [Ostrinia furnacalis]|uniref:uncharacterized protein LOC114357957 n=1 Tax=Ostrinia furnacalis TaxID=93504 RepID=UPI0010402442|nr:uncharacterized protein LOC114357957 [Ostrinia furnacalis]